MKPEPIPEVIVYGRIILIHVEYLTKQLTGLYSDDPLTDTKADLLKMHFKIIKRNYHSSIDLTDNPRAESPFLYTDFLIEVKKLIQLLDNQLPVLSIQGKSRLDSVAESLQTSYDALLDNFDDGASYLTYYH
ncbi:hypothetical protein [Secundilactobacillus muriivasis]